MIYSIYTSVDEIIDAVKDKESKEISGHFAKYEWDRMKNPTSPLESRFFGGGTEKVIKKYITPDPYEAKLIAEKEMEILSDEKCMVNKFRVCNKQTSGFIVDVSRYLNGDQRHWYSVKKKKMEYPYVKIFAPMGGLAHIKQEEMVVCGALTCAMVEMYERNSVNVELWATSCASGVFNKRYNKGSSICQMIKIKDASQYCDMRTIYFVTGYSGFYRNIVFLDRILTANKIGCSAFQGMGSSYDFKKKDIPEYSKAECENAIIIPRIYKIEQAKRWIEMNMNGTAEVTENE